MKQDDEAFSPIEGRTLKDEFIARFESLILSGRFAPGEWVPAERALATMFSVSRPVVHEGLRALETRGLVTIESRKGVRVNDYRREGSIEMLLSMFNFSGGKLSPGFFDGILQMRLLFESETARLAALNRTPEQLEALERVIELEQGMTKAPAKEIAALDYDFHLRIAIASANEIYPLLLNSFRKIYNAILETFYSDKAVISQVFSYHSSLVEAIRKKDAKKAKNEMMTILQYGESNLRRILTV